MNPLEDVEVVILRRYEAAHKAGDEGELARLRSGLEVFREAVDSVMQWSRIHPANQSNLPVNG